MQTTTAATGSEKLTAREYESFQHAYDYFNRALWNNTLPQVLVTLQRHAGARGYFAPERFNGRSASASVHELALNPDTFDDRTDTEILSTLVHEMAHVWQQTHGTPPRRCYHDKEWAKEMKRVGLQPTTTGGADGKETGQKVTHYIIGGGLFDRTCSELIAAGFRLNYQSSAAWGAGAKKKKASKTKYTCPTCGLNAWAKPDAKLICGDCYDEDEGEVTLLEPQPSDDEEGN